MDGTKSNRAVRMFQTSLKFAPTQNLETLNVAKGYTLMPTILEILPWRQASRHIVLLLPQSAVRRAVLLTCLGIYGYTRIDDYCGANIK